MFIRQQKMVWITMEEILEEDIIKDFSNYEALEEEEIYQLVLKLPNGYRTVFNLFAIEGFNHHIRGCDGLVVGTVTRNGHTSNGVPASRRNDGRDGTIKRLYFHVGDSELRHVTAARCHGHASHGIPCPQRNR